MTPVVDVAKGPDPFWRAQKLNQTEGRIVIVGAGLAGLFTALKLAPLPVTVISPASLGHGAASGWAQGGIAAAIGEGDTTEQHALDTIAAGAGLVDPEVARQVAQEAPARIRDLLRYGVPFDRDLDGHFVLSKEAAHTTGRVVRVTGDQAGAAIMAAILSAVRDSPHIHIQEGISADGIAIDNGRVTGIDVTAEEHDGSKTRGRLSADAIVIATGGSGALFADTTNPIYARGQALAFAARAGAALRDTEFVQFHPTALDVDADPAPLLSEALRGEGATLVNRDGTRFLLELHPDAELAPRDVVAQAVFNEIENDRGAYLDCRHSIGAKFPERFPTAWAHCRRAGLDPRTELLPITPVAHYHMGGIATNIDARTTVKGLWAIGEAAATGLHGANRLASNSLLEAVVFAHRAASDIKSIVTKPHSQHESENRHPEIDWCATSSPMPNKTAEADQRAAQTIRSLMSRHVGVIRNAEGLCEAIEKLRGIENKSYHNPALANMALAARTIATAALLREDSVGAHYRSDATTNHQQTPALSRWLELSDINDAFDQRVRSDSALQKHETENLAPALT